LGSGGDVREDTCDDTCDDLYYELQELSYVSM
jgi:hypothetical protein